VVKKLVRQLAANSIIQQVDQDSLDIPENNKENERSEGSSRGKKFRGIGWTRTTKELSRWFLSSREYYYVMKNLPEEEVSRINNKYTKTEVE